MKEYYETGDVIHSLIGYETVTFFEDDCEISFTAKFTDDGYEDETVSVVGVHETIEVSGLLSEDKIDDLYRKAMSVRGE